MLFIYNKVTGSKTLNNQFAHKETQRCHNTNSFIMTWVIPSTGENKLYIYNFKNSDFFKLYCSLRTY